jgi:putative aldouronate transport system permease protein
MVGMLRRLKLEWPLHLMLLPAIVLCLIYEYYPMIGIVMAFQDYLPGRGFFGSPWVGWKNFEFIFGVPEIGRILFNTVYIATMKIIAGQIVPITVAILLNEVRIQVFKRTFQTMVYLPHFLSWVLLSGILIDILSPSSGIVNKFLGLFGIEPIYFLGDEDWFPYVLVISDVWKGFGWGTIVFLAAITTINPNLYEAAEIDGAGRWKQTLHVTLPGMMPIIILTWTLDLGSVLNAGFDQVFNLYSPQVYSTGDIIDTYVFRLGLEQMQFSVSTAVGLFKSVVSLFLISLSYYLAYRFANYRIF